jgi:hypothetical protein
VIRNPLCNFSGYIPVVTSLPRITERPFPTLDNFFFLTPTVVTSTPFGYNPNATPTRLPSPTPNYALTLTPQIRTDNATIQPPTPSRSTPSSNNVNRPGYFGPDEGWKNTRPDDLQTEYNRQKLQDALASGDYKDPQMLIGADEVTRNTSKYNYVIDANGNIWVSKSGHHPDLVDGENVFGAGEVFIDRNGRIVRINSQSGHYLPESAEFYLYMKHQLDQLGVSVVDSVFVP